MPALDLQVEGAISQYVYEYMCSTCCTSDTVHEGVDESVNDVTDYRARLAVCSCH